MNDMMKYVEKLQLQLPDKCFALIITHCTHLLFQS